MNIKTRLLAWIKPAPVVAAPVAKPKRERASPALREARKALAAAEVQRERSRETVAWLQGELTKARSEVDQSPLVVQLRAEVAGLKAALAVEAANADEATRKWQRIQSEALSVWQGFALEGEPEKVKP